MAQHTPGPWVWTDGKNPININTYQKTKTTNYTDNPELLAADGTFIIGCDEYWIIGPILDHDTMVANARLIAAAPDILAALQNMVAYFKEWKDADVLEEARAAINKAEGKGK